MTMICGMTMLKNYPIQKFLIFKKWNYKEWDIVTVYCLLVQVDLLLPAMKKSKHHKSSTQKSKLF